MSKVQYLIQQSKAAGIGAFVVDIKRPSARYARNIRLIKANGMKYVARVVVFPHGGTAEQVKSQAYWTKKWRLAKYAISLGANAIQLDYIRYKPSRRYSLQNAHDIHDVIQYFDKKVDQSGIPLQIDIFGVAAHKPANYIGQNAALFANSVDVICPMLYPSHFEPYRYYAKRPYETVYNSVKGLRRQLRNHSDIKVYAFIELSNYRYPLSWGQRIDYIKKQMRGALEGGADGWYVWSAKNKYRILFQVLRIQQAKK